MLLGLYLFAIIITCTVIYVFATALFCKLFKVTVEDIKIFFGKTIFTFKIGNLPINFGWFPTGCSLKIKGWFEEKSCIDPDDFRAKTLLERNTIIWSAVEFYSILLLVGLLIARNLQISVSPLDLWNNYQQISIDNFSGSTEQIVVMLIIWLTYFIMTHILPCSSSAMYLSLTLSRENEKIPTYISILSGILSLMLFAFFIYAIYIVFV